MSYAQMLRGFRLFLDYRTWNDGKYLAVDEFISSVRFIKKIIMLISLLKEQPPLEFGFYAASFSYTFYTLYFILYVI